MTGHAKLSRIGVWLAAVLLAGIGYGVLAGPLGQVADVPPTIITFAVDMPSIPVADAEAGQRAAVLSWHVVGLTDAHHLEVHAYRITNWEPLLDSAVDSPEPSGVLPIIVRHPLNFGPPTYRLTIVDAAGRVVDQRVVMIPYEVPEDSPAILDFATDAISVGAAALAEGTARVMVRWAVANRWPTTNLVFEQVLEDGGAVSVELPRPNLWVPSHGEGPLAPLLPGSADTLDLRLRVVDMVDGSVLDERALAIPITGGTPTPAPPPTPAATPTRPPGGVGGVPPTAGPIIRRLAVSPDPVDRGGTVTVSWEVANASRVTVYRINPVGQFAEFVTDQPATGSWTLTLPDYHVDSASFYLYAEGPGGTQADGSVSVRVNCPYTYFFGVPDPPQGCPRGPAARVAAAFQPFQNGYMIWRGDTGQIFALSRGGSVSYYRDTWVEGETIPFDEPPPSPGLIQPQRGFGKVWAENQSLREMLGWAVAPEQGYTMQVQQTGAYRYARLYMTWPDGRVFYIVETQWAFQ